MGVKQVGTVGLEQPTIAHEVQLRLSHSERQHDGRHLRTCL
jgi:hypothetical protein